MSRWLVNHLLWETDAPPRGGASGWLSAKWRVVAALAGSSALTWAEWVKNHPPDIAVVAVMHFIVVLLAIALVVEPLRWLRRHKRFPSRGRA